MKRAWHTSWRKLTSDERIAAVVAALPLVAGATARYVGIQLNIPRSTAQKYLRLAAIEQQCRADPHINFRYTGAAERHFRRNEKRKPAESVPEWVRCADCGHEQSDMGRNVACEECGAGPMPSPSSDKSSE